MNDSIRLDIRRSPVEGGSGTGRESSGSPHAAITTLSMIPSCTAPMLAVDEAGNILEASEAALRLLGQSRDLLLNRPVSNVIIHLDEATLGYLFKIVSQGHTLVLEAIVKTPKEPVMACEVSVANLGKKEDGQPVAFLFLETSPSAAQANSSGLGRAERLEVAGLIAGQIAHDFNNLLTPMLAYPELIRQEIQPTAKVDDYLATIEKTSDEMQHLTQKLLVLARRGRVNREVFCVNDVVERVLQSFRSAPDRKITIESDLAGDLLTILGSRHHLQRALENLCENAIEAMGTAAGVLRLKTENVCLKAPAGVNGPRSAGEYVKITIQDTGRGIPEDTREKIFDPYFTTKRADKKKGSGLGLSIVLGIIFDHQGFVDLDSTTGQGSRFYVYLPASRQAVQQEGKADLPCGKESVRVEPERPDNAPGKPASRRILIADDEPMIRHLFAMIIKSEFPDVLIDQAANGWEATTLFSGKCHGLIVMDLQMPGQDGRESFFEIKRICEAKQWAIPPIIFCTGFTPSEALGDIIKDDLHHCLIRKPVRANLLLETIRQRLGK